MKHALLLCLSLLAAAVPLLAQDGLRNQPPPFKEQAFPHLHVINGRDNPDAIPVYEATLMMLNGQYTRDLGGFGAATRFSNDFGVDSVRADAMVAAIQQAWSDLESSRAAQTRKFCARSFANSDQWLAAVIAFDAESVSARVAAFDKLRDLAGPEVWEKILLKAHAVARAMSIAQEDHAGVAADIGYQTAFSNQCRNVPAG